MIDLLTARARLLADIRNYFEQAGVLEVSTPALSFYANTDIAIESFGCVYTGPGFAQGKNMYLHTSPEFFMKRLLVNGSGDIYQICPVFRNGEAGQNHNPEFSMLEWYRLGFDMHELMDDVTGLVDQVSGKKINTVKLTYQQAFEQFAVINPHESSEEKLKQLAIDKGINGAEQLQLDKNGWLDLIMAYVVEPSFDPEVLTFVFDFPASQASLAKTRVENGIGLASRFELYFGGQELANGFHELQDADEQLNRFMADNLKRREQNMPEMPIDKNFISALKQGLPDCSGVALGLDRLLMVLLGKSSLSEVMPFPLDQV